VLKAGDRILKINWNDVSHASQMEALSHLRDSEDVCNLEIEYDVTIHGKEFTTRNLHLVVTPQNPTSWLLITRWSLYSGHPSEPNQLAATCIQGWPDYTVEPVYSGSEPVVCY
jgi:hypothetical protein